MYGNERQGSIWNEKIRLKIGVVDIDEKISDHQLRWFVRVQRRVINAIVESSDLIQVKETKKVKEKLK